jgi:hypothetical protein
MPVGDYYAMILLILFPWLPPKIPTCMSQFDNSVVETAGLLKWISWVWKLYAYKDTVKLVETASISIQMHFL